MVDVVVVDVVVDVVDVVVVVVVVVVDVVVVVVVSSSGSAVVVVVVESSALHVDVRTRCRSRPVSDRTRSGELALNRFHAVRRAGVHPGDAVLDVACGTGDLTEAFAKSTAARVVGVDFTQAMLDVAEKKKARLDDVLSEKIVYKQGDAQLLEFPDDSFDVVILEVD